MDYKKKYKEAKQRNKSLMDKIEDLKFEISNMKNSQEEIDEYSNYLINELEDIRHSFLHVISELHRCKEEYAIIKKILLREKKSAMFRLKVSNIALDIKYKLRSIFRIK